MSLRHPRWHDAAHRTGSAHCGGLEALENSLEVFYEFAGVCVAFVRVLREELGSDGVYALGYLGVQLPGWNEVAVDMLHGDAYGGLRVVGKRAGKHLVEDHAQG